MDRRRTNPCIQRNDLTLAFHVRNCSVSTNHSPVLPCRFPKAAFWLKDGWGGSSHFSIYGRQDFTIVEYLVPSNRNLHHCTDPLFLPLIPHPCPLQLLLLCLLHLTLYCATTALDRYPSHLDKIHHIQTVTSVYICSTTFYEPRQSGLLSSSLLPSTLLPANICFHLSWATHEPHHWLIHNSLIYHICASKSRPNPTVPIILDRSCGMWWKARQWRF